VAERTPVTVFFYRHRLYASFVSSNNNSDNKSEIKSVVTLITLGTVAWVIAGLYFAITGADSKLIWTCVAGTALGAWGIRYSKRRAARSCI
jgi:uncharacterized membrane protein YjjB (DUF3815 family)